MSEIRPPPPLLPCVICGQPTDHRWHRDGEDRPRCADRHTCEDRLLDLLRRLRERHA